MTIDFGEVRLLAEVVVVVVAVLMGIRLLGDLAGK